jgi:pimeloyl-ACP methyl ester carboxylesterase
LEPGPTDPYGSPPHSAWLDIDWRAHERRLPIDGVEVNFVALGEGPTVVLVHGHDGSWHNWLENIPHLAAGHRVVAPDLPGFGASPLPGGELSIPRYAELLDALCDRLDGGSAAFIGNSMGGLICAELAIRRPARVARLVLVDAAGLSDRYGRIPVRLLSGRLAPHRALSRISRGIGSRSRFLARRRRLRKAGLGLSVRHPELISADLAALVMGGSGKPGGPIAGAALARHEIRAGLPRIACPTLIVWGADDAMVKPPAAEEFARLIPAARTVIFEDTGHMPMLERPARFNELLDEFLAGD